MKRALIFIRLGGVINLLVAILHISFWKLFSWPSELVKLTVMNSNIMQMLNLFTIVFLGYTTFVLLFKTKELFTSAIGQHFLAMMAVLYASRLAMEFYFPEKSLGFAVFLVITVLLFVVPLFQSKNLRYAH
ncbi:MAG: hypothetical protein R8G66_03400 [Cytophagales bacterium]|nr:hypothetical protein [Cytophagales bacterium]